MVDPGGGGWQPPSEFLDPGVVGPLPAVGQGGRSSGGPRSLSHRSVGHVTASDVGCCDVPKDASPFVAGSVNEFVLDTSSPSTSNFCFGSTPDQRTHPVHPESSLNRSRGARVNSSTSPLEPILNGFAAGASHLPFIRPVNVWQRPKVIPMPPVAELGQFSCDGSTAILDDFEVAVTMKKFDSAIVGRMFGKRIPYSRLSSELKLRWASFGGFRLVTMSSDCFVCFFESVEARDAVLLGGPWVVFGQVLGIDRWSPSFSPSSLIGFCTPVWVRLPCLPFYCWSSRNIGRIVALIGEPLWLDSATEQFERGHYARVCVRLDLSKPLKSGIWVDGCHGKFFQPLEYEGLSVFCCRCGQVGHKEPSCNPSRAAPVTALQQVGVLGGAPIHQSANPSSNPPPDSLLGDVQPSLGLDIPAPVAELAVVRGVGPWMMAPRRKRFNKFPESHPPPSASARVFKGKATSNPGGAGVWIPTVTRASLANADSQENNIDVMEKEQNPILDSGAARVDSAFGGKAQSTHVFSVQQVESPLPIVNCAASVDSLPDPGIVSEMEVPPHEENRRKSLDVELFDWDFSPMAGKKSKSKKKKKKKSSSQANHMVTRSQVKENFVPGALPPETPAGGAAPSTPAT